MNTNKKFLIVAGGTGGHIFPAIVFGRELESKGNNIKWLCGSRELEKEIYESANIQPFMLAISGSPLGTRSIKKIMSRCFALIKSFFQARKLNRPNVRFAFGACPKSAGDFWRARR